MQIVETSNDGLKRAYTVTITAQQISEKIEGEVQRMAPQVRMPGFRPGKVPANLIKKMHGPALHQDALNTSIRAAMDTLVEEKELRPAMQPQVELGDGYEEGKDAELSVSLEVLPVIEAPNLDGLKLEKLVVPVSGEQVDEAVERIANQQKSYDTKDGKAAEEGDQVLCDFVGKLDDEVFEGGSAENQPITIGSGQLIPGFEDQLVGVKAGDERQIKVTFPKDYGAKDLADKDVTFDITVHEVKVAGETTIDDDFAKQLGLEGLEQLTELMRGQLEQETAGLTRTQMKRSLLDQLAAGNDFDVPPSMVDAEFEQIWSQLQQEAGREEDPEAAIKEIEGEREDYRTIAVRRVRLGLLLSEIGQANNVEVSQQEMQMLIQQAVQQYSPEDRERFLQYIQSDPMVAAQLRAPLYEDKVVDFLIEQADVTEREVDREELQAAIEAENDEAKAKPAAKKKSAAKKAPAKKASSEGEKKPAKKPAAKKAPAKKAASKGDEKPAAKKKAPAKKPAAKAAAKADDGAGKKAPAKKPAAKKAAAKKAD